jgi:thiol:disulfide interchange protein DsbD
MRAFVSNDFPIDAMPLSARRIALPPLRVWLICLLWLWTGVAGAAGIDPKDLLSPQQAFQFSAQPVAADMLRVQWRIADGYYMYRDKIHFKSDNPDVKLADPVFPAPTEIKNDEYFGKEAIYRDSLSVDIPVLRQRGSDALAFTLTAISQGCADAGVCFPPHPQQAALRLAAVAPPFATPQNEGEKGFFSELGDRLGLHSNKQKFLDPDQAFMYQAEAADPDHILVRWQIAKGYYLYRKKFSFTLHDAKGISLGEYTLPAGVAKTDETFGHSEVYYNQMEVALPLQVSDGAAHSLTLEAHYQGCADAGLCYPPITKTTALSLASAATTVDSASGPASAPFVSEQDRLAQSLVSGNRFLTILLFFGAGLLLAFTPCMFPMLPILSSIIVGQGPQVTTRKAFRLSLAYVLAMAATYTFAGVLAGLFGANLQVAFQNPWIIGSFAVLFVVLALSMFGFYNLQIPSSWQTRISQISNRQKSGSLVGAAIMGMLSALIVGPCLAAPLAAALIVIGQSGNAVLGGSALFALSLGMGVPLLAIGTSAGKWLPKASAWMDAVKSIFGVLLLALAVWMLDRIIPPQATLALWGILLVVSAIYMGALERLQTEAGGWQKLWKGLGFVMMIYGGAMLLGATSGGSDPLQPLRSLSLTGTHSATAENDALKFIPVKGVKGLEQALRTASLSGKPVMLDFYADWCVSCKEMEHQTFSDPTVHKALEQAVLLQADVTANDTDDQALLKRFGIFGPPSIMFFGTDGQERRAFRVVGYLGPQEFSAHVSQALSPQSL